MAKGDIYLGVAGAENLISPFGRKFSISPDEIARKERTASGRYVKDVIATKLVFRLDYEAIDGDALEVFLDLYDLQSELNLIIDNGSTSSYTVLMSPIDRERLVLFDTGLWGGVSVELLEV